MCIRHGGHCGCIRGGVLRLPTRARRQLPLVVVQVLEEVVVPPHGVVGPGALQGACHRIAALAAARAVSPAEALFLYAGPFRFGTDMVLSGGAVRLAEGVSAGNEGNRFLIIHRHALERLANVPCCRERVRVGVRPLRVHVDQAHVVGANGSLEFSVVAVALVSEPLALRPPVSLVSLPDIRAPEGEAEGLEPHRLQGAVAGEDDQVGPGETAAVLLLDRPEQAARLVQVRVVGPAVEGREALLARASTAPAVADAVRARGVPGHADEERPVVAVVGRPPVLRGRHHLLDVLLQRIDVEGLQRLGVVEILAQRIRQGRILAENLQVQLIRPPVLIGRQAGSPLRTLSGLPG